MAKETGKKSFLDFFKMKDLDEDEFDDDLFDDDDDEDDDEDYSPRNSSRYNKKGSQRNSSSYSGQGYSSGQASNYNSQRQTPRAVPNNNRVVDFNGSRSSRTEVRGRNEVYVIVPHDTSESQTVADFLKNGKTIVINMEGLELSAAQRIIDFIGGACYAIDGSLQAISANIFIAAPSSIEVSGDLREILGASAVSPQLNQF